jgi:hypothetical protein
MTLADDHTVESIDQLNVREMLALWRFKPVGYFQYTDGGVTDHFQVRLNQLHMDDPAGWTAASKSLR